MSDDGFWGGLAIGAAIAVGTWYHYKDLPAAPPPPPEVGRYQVITHQNNAYRDFLLDTATGKTWTYVRIPGANGKDLAEMWSLQSKFDTDAEEMQYLRSIYDADRVAHQK